MARLRSIPGYLLLAFTVAATLLPRAAAAQAVTGTISGTIVDAQKAVIPGATVTIINEASADSRVATSDENGNFQVTNLQPGSYTARVELIGFRTLERTNIVLSAGERLAIGTLALDVGGLGETLTVEARGTHVNTAETQHAGVITARQIEQVQVLGRDVTSIMRLLPGVRYENTVDSLGMSFGTDVPNVGGARRDWSNVIVDGVVANEVGASGLMAQQINLDAIAEVRVLLNSYRAEYGRAGGGQVQIVSKSGSTAYHGNLYYYGRHEKLNATDFFLNRQGVKKPRYRFNTRIDAFSEVKGRRMLSEFYVQDTWRANQRLTFDYGVRFLWYSPGTRRSRRRCSCRSGSTRPRRPGCSSPRVSTA